MQSRTRPRRHLLSYLVPVVVVAVIMNIPKAFEATVILYRVSPFALTEYLWSCCQANAIVATTLASEYIPRGTLPVSFTVALVWPWLCEQRSILCLAQSGRDHLLNIYLGRDKHNQRRTECGREVDERPALHFLLQSLVQPHRIYSLAANRARHLQRRHLHHFEEQPRKHSQERWQRRQRRH